MTTSVPSLGSDRVHSYPRMLVEPLLWLSVTSGFVWARAAYDSRQASRAALAVDDRLAAVMTALAVVLILNGVAALLFASQGGSISRGLAMLAGVGMVVSSWTFTQITEIESGMRHRLVWGFLIAGIALTVLATFRYRASRDLRERGWGVMAGMTALTVAAIVLVVLCYRTLDHPLIGLGKHQTSAWGSLVPWWMLLVGVLGTMEQVWSQRWLAAALTLVAGALLAAGIAPA